MLTLTNVSERLGEAPNCQTLLGVWQRWRGERLVPTRSDALPETLGPAMSAISIMEVEARDRIIFRMVASSLEAFTGRTRKGENYVEIARPEDREVRIERLQRLIKTPCGALSLVRVHPESGITTSIQSLLLPLAKDDHSKPRFLYAAVDITSDKEWDVLPVRLSAPIASEYEYIDIGAGVPELEGAA